MKIWFTILCACLIRTQVWAQMKIDSSTRDVKSAIIGGQKFTAIFKDIPHGESIVLINSKRQTVLKLRAKDIYLAYEDFDQFEFKDFNQDSYLDLVIHYVSNVPDRQDLLLYDKRQNTFVKVKDFPNYPEPIKLKGTDLYYSYHKSGCADMNWDSDLFAIVNYKAVRLGNISCVQCDGDDSRKNIQKWIFIYALHHNKKKLLKKVPIEIIEKCKNNKWGFIKEYWTHHYNLFQQ